MKDYLLDQGWFTRTLDLAVKEYPDQVQEYFGKLITPRLHRYTFTMRFGQGVLCLRAPGSKWISPHSPTSV